MITESYTIDLFTREWTINNLLSLGVVWMLWSIAKRLNHSQLARMLMGMSVALFVGFVYQNAYFIAHGSWNLQENLPFHLCGLSSLICMAFPLLKNKQPWFTFVFYTGILGGFQSLFTPQMNHYDGHLPLYLLYYVDHLSIIVMPLLMYAFQKRELPRFSWFRAFLYLNLLTLIIMPLNYLLDANYMYLNRPPDVDNPFIIGEWPYYIFNLELVVLVLTFGLYVLVKTLPELLGLQKNKF